MAEAQRPAAVVRPLTRCCRVTTMVPAPMKPIRHALRAQTGHIRVVMQIKIEELAGKCGDRRTQANKNVGAEAGRAALVSPLDADETAAEDSQQHSCGDGGKRHVTQSIKNRQHQIFSLL